MVCPTPVDIVEAEINKIATEYRESPHMLDMIRAYLNQMAIAAAETCAIPEAFDIDTATGEILTIIGKWLGWPRCHCAGKRKIWFGFDCQTCNDFEPVEGFCGPEYGGEWKCHGEEYEEFCFTDDEVYRKFLKARAIALLRDYRRPSLEAAAAELFGASATILDEYPGNIILGIGRTLTTDEQLIIHLYREVLPVALGVRLGYVTNINVPFGFGTGWGEFCTSDFYGAPYFPANPYGVWANSSNNNLLNLSQFNPVA